MPQPRRASSLQRCQRIGFLILALALLPLSRVDGSQTCQELFLYRDTELFRSWAKTLEDKARFEDAEREAKELGRMAVREFERRDTAFLTEVLARDIKTALNAIATALDMNAASGAAKEAVRVFGIKLTPGQVDALLTGGDFVQSVNDGGLAYAFAVVWGGRIPVVGPPIKAMWEFANALEEREKAIQDQTKLYERFDRLAREIISAIQDYRDAVRRSDLALSQIAAVKEGIERFCSRQAKSDEDSRFVGSWSFRERTEFDSETIVCEGIAFVQSTGKASEYLSEREFNCTRRYKPGFQSMGTHRQAWSVKARDLWTVSHDGIRMQGLGMNAGGRETYQDGIDYGPFRISGNTLYRSWIHRARNTGSFGQNEATYTKQ